MFQSNFHVMHGDVFEDQKDRLVLVRGNANTRLLKKAVKISSVGTDRRGRALQRLSPEMQEVFGGFGGNTGVHRPRSSVCLGSSVSRVYVVFRWRPELFRTSTEWKTLKTLNE